jgi:hypothetical protein
LQPITRPNDVSTNASLTAAATWDNIDDSNTRPTTSGVNADYDGYESISLRLTSAPDEEHAYDTPRLSSEYDRRENWAANNDTLILEVSIMHGSL